MKWVPFLSKKGHTEGKRQDLGRNLPENNICCAPSRNSIAFKSGSKVDGFNIIILSPNEVISVEVIFSSIY